MSILDFMHRLAPEATAWRRHLHTIPELGFEEHETSAFVAAKLDEWGIPYVRMAGTGLVGTLRAGTSARSIGIRADLDALPMEEANDFAWRSRTPGRMHACGHDGHTTMLLGAARYLSQTRRFDGTVNFIFQPAEEGPGGARVMVEEGLFDRFPCDMVFGAHNDSRLPLGQISVVEGAVSAAADTFGIRVTGRGGHAARPHHTIDPLLAATYVAQALQSLVSRRMDSHDSVVVSITQFHAGTADNIIAHEAELRGTVRTLQPHARDQVEKLMTEVAQAAAAAAGAQATVTYHRGYPPVVNAPLPTARAVLAASRLVGEAAVQRQRPPSMGAEDFAYLAQAVPGCFVRIGQASDEHGSVPGHNRHYDFNDAILPLGSALWATLAEQELAPAAAAGDVAAG